MNKIKFKVIKEKNGFSASAKHHENHLFAEGETPSDLKKSTISAVHAVYPATKKEEIEQSIVLIHNIRTIFDFLPIKKKALAKRIKMNPSLLTQYAEGIKKPSKKQLERIQSGIVQLGKELIELELY